MSEYLSSKYLGMLSEFKQQIQEMLTQDNVLFSDMIESTKVAFKSLQEDFRKGRTQIESFTSTGDKTILDLLKENYESIKSNLEERFNALTEDEAGLFQRSIEKFKAQCKDISHRIPRLASSTYESVVDNLNTSRTNLLEESQEQKNKLLLDLDEAYQKLVKELTRRFEGSLTHQNKTNCVECESRVADDSRSDLNKQVIHSVSSHQSDVTDVSSIHSDGSESTLSNKKKPDPRSKK